MTHRVLTACGATLAVSVILLLSACGGGGDDGGSFDVPSEYTYPVETPARLSDRSHFPVGQTYDAYTSDPPTSGPHASSPAPWGLSDVEVPKEMAVHNMEHAGVVVWYNCNAGQPLSAQECGELRSQLAGIVQPRAAAGGRVLLTPYAGMDSRVAVTAWGFLDKLDDFDAQHVTAFIDSFECNYDPESFCS